MKKQLPTDEAWHCPMQCYWALKALKSDGNFITPDIFTGWLAKTKHFCILTAALHAIVNASKHSNGLIGCADISL